MNDVSSRETSGAGIETLCSILREQFVEKVGTHPLRQATGLKEELNLDSLDLLTLAAVLENLYDRPVLDEHTSPSVFSTIGSLAAHLASVSRADSDCAQAGS